MFVGFPVISCMLAPGSSATSGETISDLIAALPYGGTITLEAKLYDIGAGFSVPDNIRIIGQGATTVLRAGAMPRATITVPTAVGGVTVSVDDATGFKADLSVMPYSHQKYGIYKIKSVSGNVLNLSTPLKAIYPASAGITGMSTAISIEGSNVELANFTLEGNRENRLGGIPLIYNGFFDGSNEGDGYKDGAINIGYKVSTDSVYIHDLTIQNTSADGIRGQATTGIHHGSWYLHRIKYVNIGDKAALFRSSTSNPGTIDYVEILGGSIDGTGKHEQNDRSAGKASWGDGIQGHTFSPTSMYIGYIIINDTARSGIWVMASNNTSGHLTIENVTVTNWGQKQFGNESQIDVSGILINRPGMVRFNHLNGGFTQSNPRQDRNYGIRVVAITSDTATVVQGNEIRNFWSTVNTPGLMFQQVKNGFVLDNFIDEGKLGIYFIENRNVIASGNNLSYLNMVFGNGGIYRGIYKDNIVKSVVIENPAKIRDNTVIEGNLTP